MTTETAKFITTELSHSSPIAKDAIAQKISIILGWCEIGLHSRELKLHEIQAMHDAARTISEMFGMPQGRVMARAAVREYQEAKGREQTEEI